MRKKRKIYCKCGAEVQIYKKSKKHRVFVCSNCGIIATNPLPLLPILAAAAPYLIEKGVDLISGIGKKKPKVSSEAETVSCPTHKLTQFEKALLLERIRG